MLVKILGFDDVTCLGSGTSHCQVPHVARLGINALIGPLPGGTRCEPIRAGREWPGVVSLANAHVSRGEVGMADLCVRAEDIRGTLPRLWRHGFSGSPRPFKEATELRGGRPGRSRLGLRARVRYYRSRAAPCIEHTSRWLPHTRPVRRQEPGFVVMVVRGQRL
jgi:hypothetical protein